jgi:hypothetical protein
MTFFRIFQDSIDDPLTKRMRHASRDSSDSVSEEVQQLVQQREQRWRTIVDVGKSLLKYLNI